MAIVLGGIGLFVYLRFERELEASIDERLRSRAADLSGLVREAEFESSETRSAPVGDGGEDFAQVLEANGRVVGGTARLRNRSLLSDDELLLGRDALRVDVARERRPARAHARVVEVVPAPVRLPRPPRLGRRLLRPHLLDLLRGVDQVLVARLGRDRLMALGPRSGTDTTGRVAQGPIVPFLVRFCRPASDYWAKSFRIARPGGARSSQRLDQRSRPPPSSPCRPPTSFDGSHA